VVERGAEQEESLQRLAHQTRALGIASGDLASQVQEAASGQLSFAESVRLSSQAIAQGFNPAQIKTFTQLAEAASDVLGGSIASNFDTLVSSIATGRTTVLKQIGILVDLEEEKKKLALATGRATSEITLMEEKQILLNAAMKQAPAALARVGAGVDSTADKLTRAEKKWEDLWDAIALGAKTVAIGTLDVGGAFIKKALTPTRNMPPTLAGATGASLLGPSAFVSEEEKGRRLVTEAIQEQTDALQPMAHWLGVSAESLRMMTDEERGNFVVQASLRDQLEDLAEGVDAYSLILRGEAEALLKSADAARIKMQVDADHTKVLAQETAETEKLIKARSFLADLDQAEAGSFLTRGSPEDALSQIRQKGFSGGAKTPEQLQELIRMTHGLPSSTSTSSTGLNPDQQRIQDEIDRSRGVTRAPVLSAFEKDRSRLLRDLTAERRTSAERAIGSDNSTQPFGPGSQIIQPSAGGVTLNVTVNGSLADAGALTQLIRERIQPELLNIKNMS
jgi:hypothetical protein